MEQLSPFPYSKHDTCTTISRQAYKWVIHSNAFGPFRNEFYVETSTAQRKLPSEKMFGNKTVEKLGTKSSVTTTVYETVYHIQ